MILKNILIICAAFVVSAHFAYSWGDNSSADKRFSAQERQSPSFMAKQSLQIRGSLSNCKAKFEGEKFGRVAFLGGSITEMKGWRNMVKEALQERFPNTKFDFVEAGISSTGSTPGAFRLKNDILSKGDIDLIFIENAVNDDTNGFSPTAQIRGMEGEIRQVLMKNPRTDIVVLHFIYDPFIPIEARGETPVVIINHEKVCAHYQVPSINLSKEISRRMRDSEFDWKKFGGTHPSPFGHKYYAAAIENLFDKMWKAKPEIKDKKLPAPLDEYSYFNGRFVDLNEVKISSGWKIKDNWKPSVPPLKKDKSNSDADTLYSFDGGKKTPIKAHTRKGFVDVPMLEAQESGAEFSLEFVGRAIGIFCAAGPYSGILEYSIDGSEFKKLDTFTPWSSSLYIPWVYTFCDELKLAKHKIIVRMSDDKNTKSIGNSCQIRNILVN